jgi:hypothetical protein
MYSNCNDCENGTRVKDGSGNWSMSNFLETITGIKNKNI